VSRRPLSGEAAVVLVSGCSSGIGRASAERLARAGHAVVATARSAESLAGLGAAGCMTLALDVTVEASMRAGVDEVLATYGRIDALVNNAGYSQSGALETVPMDAVRRQFETNVFGLLRMCQLVLPAMRARGRGRIVNISSMGANFTFPGGGAYHATKYAVEALSDALRFEVRGFGIDVVVVQPGLIRTAFAATAGAGVPSGDGPYGSFNAAVARLTRESYEKGPVAAVLGGSAERVAGVIERAITTPRPRARYRVTPSAHLLVALRRLLGDRGWDAFTATQFPRPGLGD
jgi:NAD(P)-dependent dehydrogenase (short-subunit alcohol dehydrogenase family)